MLPLNCLSQFEFKGTSIFTPLSLFLIQFRRVSFRNSHASVRSLKRMLAPALFTTGYCTLVFTVPIIASYEIYRKKMVNIRRKPSLRQYNDSQILNSIQQYLNQLNKTQRIFLPIIVLNTLILCVWRLPIKFRGIHSTMNKWFKHSLYSPSVTLVASTFSHISVIHLFCNVYCLWSFLPGLHYAIGPEISLSVFLGGCCFSSFFSLLYKNLRQIKLPSLGASGGVAALLTTVALAYPHSQFTTIVPTIKFSGESVIWGVCALSIAGMMFRRFLPFLDHAAHLGGVLFAYTYYQYIQSSYLQYVTRVIRVWSRIR